MPPEQEERLEPPAASAIASGADQAGVRLYNERLILSLVRRYRQLSKIEVARLTGLSVQSTSAIMNRLQLDGLLRREAPATRARRPADRSAFARSRGRVFVRPEDRTAKLRTRARRFRRADTPTRPGDFRLSDAQVHPRFCVAHAAAVHADPVAEAASPRGRARRRVALSIVELGRRDRRAAWRDGRLANHRHRAGSRAAVPVSGDALQRRDLGLRGGVLLRRGVAPSRLSLFLSRLVRRRRPRHRRRLVSGPHRKRRALGSMPIMPLARPASRLRN